MAGPKINIWGVTPSDATQGPPGEDGTDGSQIRTGAGAPSNGLGVNNDYYLDTASEDLDFYKKSGGSYTIVANLKGDPGAQGDPGADGADGASIRYGSGAPDDGDWNDGDYYINTTSGAGKGDVYVKGAGTWGSPVINLIGPQGVQGIQGIQGIQGVPGAAGADGVDGTDGATILYDNAAPDNGNGNNGDVFFNTTSGAGKGDVYFKATGTWGSPVLNIVGPAGAAGAAGADGIDGIDGTSLLYGTGVPNNLDGNDDDLYLRSNGDLYLKVAGDWGSPVTNITGPAGAAGADGADGADGVDGFSILSGSAAPDNGNGVDNDLYFRTNGSVYKKVAGDWGSPIANLTGPTGPTGPAGAGDVVGPAGAVAGSVPVLDATGKNLDETPVTIDMTTGDVAGVGDLAMSGALTGATDITTTNLTATGTITGISAADVGAIALPTIIVTTADFTTGSTTPVAVVPGSGPSFSGVSLVAGKRYRLRIHILHQCNATTSIIRLGLNFSNAPADLIARTTIGHTSASNGSWGDELLTTNNTVTGNATNTATANTSHYAYIDAIFTAHASGGTFAVIARTRINSGSETVSVMTGSVLVLEPIV